MPSTPIDQLVLRHLRVTPLKVVFLMEEEWSGPRVKSPLLRSALGFHLRERECLTGAPDCHGCLRKQECWYALAFETPAEVLSLDALMHGDRQLPHPFYLAAGEIRPKLHRGEELTSQLSLFGNAQPLLKKILDAMSEAGKSARWGGRFRLERVVSAVDPLARASGMDAQGVAGTRAWPEWGLPPRRPARKLAMDLITPLRLRIRGRVQREPSFVEILRGLLRRVHLLVHLYSNVQLPKGWGNSLLASAESVTARARWQFVEASRTSGARDDRIDLSGCVGRLDLSGDALDDIFPFLDVGRYIGVGSKTSHGCGCYALENPRGLK